MAAIVGTNAAPSALDQPTVDAGAAAGPGVPDATVAVLSRGVNLQGWKFWDASAFITPEMAAQMKADGFGHARIYYHAGMTKTGWVDWNVTQQFPGSEAELDADWVTGQVEGSMQNLIAAGMKVVICAVPDFHPGETEAQRDLKLEFLKLWVPHVIEKFGSEDIVIETTNEPAFDSAAEWQAIERRVIDIVRSVSADVTIVSATQIFHDGNWDALGGFGAHQPYADENVVYSAHTYNPVPFTTQEYGHVKWPADPAENPGGEVGWFYGGQHTRLAFTKEILTYGTLADAKGMERWMLGEFGVDASAADAQSRQAYFSTLTQAVERAGGGWGIWKGIMDDHEMPIYDVVQENGANTVRLKEAATRESLGLVERAPVPLTVSFGAADQQDLLHPFRGASSHHPDATQTLDLAGGQMGGAGGSATVVRSGQTVSVTGSGAPAGVGVLDDQALDVSIAGVERAQVEAGAHGDSRVEIAARDATVVTGGGADAVAVSLAPMAGNAEPGAWIWTGAGADRVSVSVAEGASGGRVEIAAGAGDDRVDAATRGGELQVNAGSGDDVVNLAGMGGAGGGSATVDGGVGRDAVVLQGKASEWRMTDASDAQGQATLARHDARGSYLLRNTEEVRFAEGGEPPKQGVEAPEPVETTVGSGPDSLVLKISQDAYQGSARYTVKVDGQQVGGTFAASAWHSAGQSDTLTVKGDWAAGAHQVEVAFLNDAWGGTAAADRNLYVDGATYNGQAVQGAAKALMATGAQDFSFADAVTGPGPGDEVAGTGPDSLVLKVSQDAYQGSAQYTVKVDGVQVGGTFTASAAHAAGRSDTLTLKGDWGPGEHQVGVEFLNDKWDGTPATDRNLYVDGAAYNGAEVQGAAKALMSAGAQGFAFTDTAPAPEARTGTEGADLFDATAAGGVFTGKGGRDMFVFDAGDGQVTITDFTPGTDKLLFVGFDEQDVSAAAATSGPPGLVVHYGDGGTLFLAGVTSLADRDTVFA